MHVCVCMCVLVCQSVSLPVYILEGHKQGLICLYMYSRNMCFLCVWVGVCVSLFLSVYISGRQ